MKRRQPPIAFAFALLSGLLAFVTMRLLGTPLLDAGAYRSGVAIAAATGLATGIAFSLLQRHPRTRRTSWALVPLAGCFVGMMIQWLLFVRVPDYRTYMLASGLTTRDPVSWVLAGAPFGAVPALVIAAIVAVALRVMTRVVAQDNRERAMLPFAAACAILGAASLGSADVEEMPVIGGVVVLALAALVEILILDARRWRWLRAVFAGEDSAHEVVPLDQFSSAAEVPLAVGAAPTLAVIVKIDDAPGYRTAARNAIAATALDEFAATLPLRFRRKLLVTTFAVTALAALISLSAR